MVDFCSEFGRRPLATMTLSLKAVLNSVLLARQGPVEIRKVECHLTKMNETVKKYSISPLKFGQICFGHLTANSAITFTIGPGFRELYRVSIEQKLSSQANQTIYSKNEIPTFPEYNPTDVVEI